MSDAHRLPHLDETITQIIVELLLIEKERRFPALIMGSSADKTATRATMHYVRALLSYGFSPETPALQEAIDWFDRPFPQSQVDHVDPQEMNRLMILLLARPQNENVRTRLAQLWEQQVDDGFDVQPGWGGYDTLWALEVFTLAKQQGALPDYCEWDKLGAFLDQMITGGSLPRDKDRALALRLQHEHFGGLKTAHKAELQRLIEDAVEHNGIWGMEELGWLKHRMGWLEEFIGSSKVIPQDVREYQDQFRRIVLSTSMVIENLAPLRKKYPRLNEPLECALNLWWLQFEGKHTIETLRSLFPKPHDFDYLRVLCRTLRAIRAYVGQPLGTVNEVQVHVLHELADMKKNLSDPPVVRNIREALRSWIRVDLERELEALKLGFSEANVVRVRPRIRTPLSNNGQPLTLGDESVIIKYGPRAEIEMERHNYDRLAGTTKEFFVRIPEASHIDMESSTAYVIMQDLHDFKTLYEARTELKQGNVIPFANQLAAFLERMHEDDNRIPKPIPNSLLREIYLRKMMEYIDRIFDFVWEYKVVIQRDMVQDIQHELFEQIGILLQKQGEMGDFPSANMHGDLHMRNIMVRGLDDRNDPQNSGLTFKLIDLEYLDTTGDAAFDAGQLLVDITLVGRDEPLLESQNQLERLHDILAQTYREFGQRREDTTFGVRLELAKARALLRIAKGKTKRGSRYVKEKQSAQAAQLADEVIGHATEALHYLRAVTTNFRGDANSESDG
jgi:hypothetical protein